MGASLAEGRCPQPPPHILPTLVGGKGGAGRPAPGGAGSRANPSFPAPKIPATGRGRPPRKRPLCEYNTPSAVPWLGTTQLDLEGADGGMWRGCRHPCHSACARRSSPGGAGHVGGLPSTPASPYIKGSLAWFEGVSGTRARPPPIPRVVLEEPFLMRCKRFGALCEFGILHRLRTVR